MDWIFQNTGLINRFNPNIHKGEQPIRVLHHMNIWMFQNTHPNFPNELSLAFDKNGLSKTVDIVYGENKVKGPFIRVQNKRIVLQETFLSYLWCVTHSIYVIYVLKIEQPKINQRAGKEFYSKNEEDLNNAEELFEYAKSLISTYAKWDKKSQPNPEIYLAEKRDLIEQPNCFYTEAVKFILCHEYTHGIKHLDVLNSGEEVELSGYINFEKEADSDAIDLMLKGIFPNKINELPIQIGITIGLLSMFFFKATTENKIHPNTEDRLVDALEQMEISDNHYAWGIALVGLRLWDEQFGLDFKWTIDKTDKEQFYDLIEQIKQ